MSNSKTLLWVLAILYQAYAGVIGGPLTLVLDNTPYKHDVGLILGVLHLGFLCGFVLENLLEKHLNPATISMVGAWLLSACMGGYLLLFTMERKILPLFLLLRMLEGMSSLFVFDGLLYMFKQYYQENEEKLKKAVARRSMATAVSLTFASAVAASLSTKLSPVTWQLLNGCAVSLTIALFCTILRLRIRITRSEDRATAHEQGDSANTQADAKREGGVHKIQWWTLLGFMLGVLAPATITYTLLHTYLPAYVNQHSPYPVPFFGDWTAGDIMAVVLSLGVVGGLVGSYSTEKIPSKWTWRYQLLGGYIPLIAGMILLAIGGHRSFWVLYLAQVLISWGNSVVLSTIETSLQKLRLNLGKQEGMKQGSSTLARFVFTVLFSWLFIKPDPADPNQLKISRGMWLVAALIPLVGIVMLPKWAAFILRHSGNGAKEARHDPQRVTTFAMRVKSTLLGFCLWYFLLRPR